MSIKEQVSGNVSSNPIADITNILSGNPGVSLEADNPSDVEDDSQLGELGDYPELGNDGVESDSSDSDSVSAAAPDSKQLDTEEIFVKGKNGKESVKINYSDREAIKDAFKKAHGMRKAFSERDELKRELESLKKNYNPDVQERLKTFDALDEAFQSDGIRGVINLLQGKPDAYDNWTKAEYEKRKAYESALPSERELLDKQAALDAEKKRTAQIEAKYKKMMEDITKTKEEADYSQLRSVINPAFEKYALSKDMNDADAGARLDKALWRDALEEIEAMPDDVELTSSMVEDIFRKTAATYRKVIAKQVDSKVKSTIEKKKTNAQESLVAAATKTQKQNGVAANFNEKIRQGNGTGAITDYLISAFSKKSK